MNNADKEIWQKCGVLVKPELPMTVSEWADKYRILSPGLSAEPGNWSTDRTPYLREIMDAPLDPVVESVSLMCAAQSGKSSFCENEIGFYSSFDPANIMLVRPTLASAEEFSKTRLQKMIDDSPILRSKFLPEKSRDSSNTLLMKSFVGGTLFMVGSNAPAGLASRSCRILICDETDRFPPIVSEEGDILELAKARTTTFYNRKHIYVSTPTISGASRIESLFLAGDQRRFNVECPDCHNRFVFQNDCFHFDRTDKGELIPGSEHMVCKSCGSIIQENQKLKLLAAGKWIPAFPERKKHRSYHLSAFSSPFVSWTQMAEWILEANMKGREVLKTLVNLRFAEPWINQQDELTNNPDDLLLRAIEYRVPTEILMVTCGIDIQQNRIEALVLGWGRNFQSWVLEHRVFASNPDQPEVWKDVDQFLQKTYTRDDGRVLSIDVTMIDSGYVPGSVRAFTTPRWGRVYASIGRNIKDIFKDTKDEQGNPYYDVSTDKLKDLILNFRLMAKPGQTGYMNFNLQSCNLEFFRQLCAEHTEIKYDRGVAKIVWKQDRERNEILDCYALNTACLYIKVPEWDALEKNRAPLNVPAPVADTAPGEKPKMTPAPGPYNPNPFAQPRRSNWVTRY